MADRTPQGMEVEGHTPRGEETLARQAAGGVMWQGLSYFLGKLVVFATTVVLARLLTPEDFGIFAMTLVFVMYAERLSDLGVAQALVFLPGGRRTTDAALTTSLIFAAGLALLGLAVSPIVADFFNRPDATPLFRVMALSLLFRGTGGVPDALLRKRLLFRRRLVPEFCRAAAQGTISITLAVNGVGAWSIVLGYVCGDLVWNVMAWLLVDYRPRWGFWRNNREITKQVVKFGAPAAGQGFLLAVVWDIDYLIIGRALGSAALGYYTLGFRIPQAVIIPVFWALSSVAFPVITKLRDEPERLARGYLRWIGSQTAYGVAAGVGLAVMAPTLVEVFFGEKWTAAVVPLQALAIYAAVDSFNTGALDLLKGIGRPVLAMWLSVGRLIVVAPALIIATRWGINAVSWTQTALAAAIAVVMQGVVLRALGIGTSRFLRSLWPATCCGLGTVLGAGSVRGTLAVAPGIELVLGILAGAAGAVAGLHLADRNIIRDSWALIRKLPQERSGASDPADPAPDRINDPQ